MIRRFLQFMGGVLHSPTQKAQEFSGDAGVWPVSLFYCWNDYFDV